MNCIDPQDILKISVIVPVYNAETYLHRCIDSILSQTFTDFELILVEDGSIDKSGEICDEYATKDSRVRVFHKREWRCKLCTNYCLIDVVYRNLNQVIILYEQNGQTNTYSFLR